MFKKLFLISSVLVLLAAGCSKPSPQAAQAPVQQRQQIQVTEKVQGDVSDELFNFYADENKTALDILKTNHKVDVIPYSGIGDFVTAINGDKPDSKHFWEFFINGKSSNVGASSYKPVNGDKLEWKISAISNNGE